MSIYAQQHGRRFLTPCGEVLSRVGQELQGVAAATQRLQDSLCEILSETLPAEHRGVHDLQEIDTITQQLENLAQYIQALSTAEEFAFDTERAAKYLTLADLAGRLRDPSLEGEDLDLATTSAGDVELF
ncbi:MAG: hypothetical protein AAFX08_03450 [Pseudomonadota bacterium]